jgi:hypothetical protein
MGNNDILILTVYFLVVIYVLYQMAISLESQLEDQVQLDLDVDRLLGQVNQQLSRQRTPGRLQAQISQGLIPGLNLGKLPPSYRQLELAIDQPEGAPFRAAVAITVLPLGKRPKGPAIQFLSVQVINRSSDLQIYLDWDRSSITYMSPQSQRVIRVLPGINFDLAQQQVFTVVNPGEMLKTDVTTERTFVRNPETQRLEPKKPLIEIAPLAAMLSGEDEVFKKQKSVYSLSLLVGLRAINDAESQTTYLLLPFSFDISLLQDEIAFPPLRWLLSRPRNRAEHFWNNLLWGPNVKR